LAQHVAGATSGEQQPVLELGWREPERVALAAQSSQDIVLGDREPVPAGGLLNGRVDSSGETDQSLGEFGVRPDSRLSSR
jgi:hypothetical protein